MGSPSTNTKVCVNLGGSHFICPEKRENGGKFFIWIQGDFSPLNFSTERSTTRLSTIFLVSIRGELKETLRKFWYYILFILFILTTTLDIWHDPWSIWSQIFVDTRLHNWIEAEKLFISKPLNTHYTSIHQHISLLWFWADWLANINSQQSTVRFIVHTRH